MNDRERDIFTYMVYTCRKFRRISSPLGTDLLEESLAKTETCNVVSFGKLQRPSEGANTGGEVKRMSLLFNRIMKSQKYLHLSSHGVVEIAEYDNPIYEPSNVLLSKSKSFDIIGRSNPIGTVNAIKRCHS